MGLYYHNKPPDTSGVDKERQRLEKERDRIKQHNQARLRNLKNRGRGRSLLLFHKDPFQ